MRVSESRMELAPIMPTDGAARAIVLARLAESRQRKTAVNVSIFANLLAKIRSSEENAKKNKRIYSFFVERERFRRSQRYNFFLQNTYCLQDFYLHKACGALVVRVRAFPQFVSEKHKINHRQHSFLFVFLLFVPGTDANRTWYGFAVNECVFYNFVSCCLSMC